MIAVSRVIIMPEAKRDLRQAGSYIRQESAAARRWYQQMNTRSKTLSRNPQRRALAQESGFFDEPIHELLCGTGNRGTYRVLFAIIANTVNVLYVRHG